MSASLRLRLEARLASCAPLDVADIFHGRRGLSRWLLRRRNPLAFFSFFVRCLFAPSCASFRAIARITLLFLLVFFCRSA